MIRKFLLGLSAPIAAAAAVFAAIVLFTDGRGAAPAVAEPTGRGALTTLVEYQTSPSATPATLDRAERQAREALRRDPADVEALDALAVAAASRHRFREALRLTERSLELAPERLAPLGIRGDALIELGRYRKGFAVAEASLNARPDIASYARASYAAELRGNQLEAIALMRLAAESGLPGNAARTGSQLQLGLLLLREGRIDAAAAAFRTIGRENPGNPEAVIGAARVAVARGQLRRAESLYRKGIVELPDADHWAELADVQQALGKRNAARSSVAKARAGLTAGAEVEDNAVERVVLEADWTRPDAALIAEARAARERRPSVTGDAALAWVLTRASRCGEAHRLARRSLRLGTRDPLMIFRAAMAARCAGDADGAAALARRARALNPSFSARWAPAAARLAEAR